MMYCYKNESVIHDECGHADCMKRKSRHSIADKTKLKLHDKAEKRAKASKRRG